MDMPRPRSCTPLESGLKIDLNELARKGLIRPGASSRSQISWTDRTGKEIASGFISTGATGPDDWLPNDAWCNIELGRLHQRIKLVSRPRNFGGRQWYFFCRHMGLCVSVLWKPPGAPYFACRQRWRLPYNSQCSTRFIRAYFGQTRIKSRLCAIGRFDPYESEFPPKPKWMRWRTYKRAKEKFDHYQATLNRGAGRRRRRLD
jgi:hypothetical protein